MKYCILSCCIFSLFACTAGNDAEKARVEEIKATQRKRIEFLRIMPEPFIKKIPDSAKKWIPIFRSVLADDQKHRIIGYNVFTKDEKDEQQALDSINLTIVIPYLDKYGWPTLDESGFIVQRAVVATMQHAPLPVQEKYFPVLVRSFAKDHTLSEAIIMLEDRINIRNHRCQYYGTQIVTYKGKQTLYPVCNIDSVNAFRKKMGYKINLEQYLILMNAELDINEYKRILPELKKENKVSDSLGIHFEPQKLE
jgi:hypothetical protein